MADIPNKKLITALAVVVGIGYVVINVLGNRLNNDQLLGCLVASAFMFSISLVGFLFGALPFRALGASDKAIRRAFIFACVSLVYSVLQIPIWTCMTHQFPPGTMNGTQAGFATVGVVIALFGPAAPWTVKFVRFVRERNMQQREALRRKKEERNEP
jgi:hypothetical protein